MTANLKLRKAQKAKRKDGRKRGRMKRRTSSYTHSIPRTFHRIRSPRIIIDPEKSWYGLRARSHHRLEQQLRDDKFQTFLPVVKVQVQRRGKLVETVRAPAPGYVLVAMEPSGDARADLWGYHDTKIAEGRRRPFLSILGPIPADDLQQFSDWITGNTDDQPEIARLFMAGEDVRVTEGPFAALSGVVEGVDERRARVRVSVSMFGRPTPVDLEYAQVERVD
jgi:transcription termination/antitermination protein NusG